MQPGMNKDLMKEAASFVVIPTYNEADNVYEICTAAHVHLPEAHVLIVDDNSPDGTGKIASSKRGGRRMTIIIDGKKLKFRVSGSGTKITVDGKKAKRKAVKVGMSCAISYLGPDTTARSMDCQS